MTRRFRQVVGLAAVSLSMVVAGCEAPDPTHTQRIDDPQPSLPSNLDDVSYGPRVSEHLDVHLPARANGGVVVWVHGGGWADDGGSDGTYATEEAVGMQPIVTALFDRGWTVVSVGYTDSLEAPLPQQLFDVQLAIRWVRRHSAEFGVDPSAVVVMGWSAGGHLAALAGTATASLEAAEIPDALRAFSPRPDAVVSIEGVLDPSTFAENPGVFESNPIALAAALGCPGRPSEWRTCDPDLLRAICPLTHLDPSDPPIYIVAGDRDGIVELSSQALAPYARYRAVLGDGNVMLDVVDTGTPEEHDGLDPRNHSMAISYELNADTLFRFVDAFLPATAPSASPGRGGAVHVL